MIERINDASYSASGMLLWAMGVVSTSPMLQVAGLVIAGLGVGCAISREIRAWIGK